MKVRSLVMNLLANEGRAESM